MKTEFIPYEQALTLKELGFDEPCFGKYDIYGVFDHKLFYHNHDADTILNCSAPTFSQAFRFFREKYGLFVAPSVISYEGGPHLWFFEINSTTIPFGTDLGVTDDFNTYEEAELACLIKLIEQVRILS